MDCSIVIGREYIEATAALPICIALHDALGLSEREVVAERVITFDDDVNLHSLIITIDLLGSHVCMVCNFSLST